MIALAPTPTILTERLRLRAPQGSDWPHWQAFMASERAGFIGGGPATPKQQAWRAFGHVIGHWALRGFGSFVFTLIDDDRPLGLTGPWFPEGWPEHEIGWTVWSPEAEGKGFAHEAAAAARGYAFQTLGWTSAVSYINKNNARSIALAKRLGAQPDADAALPEGSTDCLVFRHPNGAAA